MVTFFLIVLAIVLLDQITKFFLTDIHYGLINYTTNTGAGFSILQGQTTLLIFISLIVLGLILYYRKKEPEYGIPLAFIFAGTLGNLIDRLYFGYVRDFIDLKVWPIFNIADLAMVIGVILIIYISLRTNRGS